MALNPKTAVLVRNAALDAFDTLNSGKLRGYTSPQPTDADTALVAQKTLFELALSATAFAAAASGSKAANSISDDVSASAGGDASNTVAWASLLTGGNVRKLDFSVDTSGANLNLNATLIALGAKVSVTSLTITQAA